MAGRLASGLLKNNVLVGQVVPSNLQNALKVQVALYINLASKSSVTFGNMLFESLNFDYISGRDI